MKKCAVLAILFAVETSSCASSQNDVFINEDGQECRVTYNQIYQPPVTVGGAGSTISVPGDTICTDPEKPNLPEGAIVPSPEEAARTTASINQAQREALSFFESQEGPNVTCKIIGRGENRVEAIECQKTSGGDLWLRGMFEDGVAGNLEKTFSLPAQVRLFDSTLISLGANEKHLLESWAVWGADDTEPVVYNAMFVKFYEEDWRPMAAGFGQPSENVSKLMSPSWINRPESRGRVIPKEKPKLTPID